MMRQRRVGSLRLAALTSAAVMGLALVGTPPADAGGRHGGSAPKTVATGLDNPRQLSFTSSGDLLVAEAGEGGAGPCMPGPEGGEVCFGATGAVTKITSRGRQYRVISGLPSLARKDDGSPASGGEATGPSDVRGSHKSIAVLIGLGADPAVRAGLPEPGQQLGTLIQTTKHKGKYRTIADLAAFEAEENPINDPDSNPVGMLYDHGRYVVADAGGNTVLTVNRRGGIRVLAEFENVPPAPDGLQAVPTSVATKGWDGAYYVSQLTGFPFPKGAANIFRIDPRTGAKTVYASGLTNVTDLAFKGRTLYAVQISSEGLLTGPIGSVVEVEPGGTDHDAIAEGLFAPYGIAIKGDYAYVTVGSVAKDDGQVLRIRL